MTSSPPTLVGYNNNVRYRGMRFHIQTEDSGITRPHITTHLFADGGYVIKSLRTDYAEHVGHPERAAMVQRMMRDQHRAMALDLRDGKLDATIERLAPPPADEPEEAPASVPTPSELAATPSTFAPSSSPAPAEAPCAAAPDTVIPPASGSVGSITERPPSQPFSPSTALPVVEALAQPAARATEPSNAPAAASHEVEAPEPAVAQVEPAVARAEPADNMEPTEAPPSEPAAKGSASRRSARRAAGENPKNGRGSDKPASSRAASSRPSASSRRSQSSKPASSKRPPNPLKQSGQRPSLALDATTLEQLAGTRKAQSSSRPPSSRGGKSRPAPSSRGAASARASTSTRATSSRPPTTRASAAPRAASTTAGASSSRPPSSRGSASTRGGASTRATSQRPSASEGKPARVTPTAPPASAPASSRRAGRPAASLPKKPSGESLFGPLPQESLDDAILSYVAKSKNGPPTRRGSK